MADKPWKKFERDIARIFGTSRRLMKGTNEKMDIGDDDFPLMLDCKRRVLKSWSVASWLKKLEEAATATGKYPVLVLGEPGKQRKYAVVRREPFMSFIMERCKGFTSDQFYAWNASVTPRVPRLKQWDKLLKSMRKDQHLEKAPKDAMPILYVSNKKHGNTVMLKPEDLARIFRDGGLLPDPETEEVS